jgi:hypothetical protein
MLVVCAGMRRSGSTLQYNIARQLARNADAGQGYGLWDRLAQLRERAAPADAMAIVKEHAFDARFAGLSGVDTRIVYSYRDLRDVLVSFFQVQGPAGGNWPAHARRLLRATLDDFTAWTRQPGVLISKYEAFTGDIPGEVRRIASHLGIAVNGNEVSAIAERVSVEAHRKIIEVLGLENPGESMDPVTLLKKGHLAGGEIGKWRARLDADQLRLVQELAGDWLSAHGY